MGWSSWNEFNDRVTDADIRHAADALVSSGMRDAGYTYVNIDDSWQGQRDASGYMHPNARFPDMQALVDYVHARHLKIGIYSSPGPKTCDKFPGSYGYEAQDAKTFAEWGFDYLKYDLCSFKDVLAREAPGDPAKQKEKMIDAYRRMNQALLSATQAAGRAPMVFSICQYGLNEVWKWGPDVGGSLWRTTYDIYPVWTRVVLIAEAQNGLEGFAGPGHWNDPDLLVVGNGKMDLSQDRTHFSWWAMLAAPLFAGNNLPAMSPEVRAVFTNKDVIAIDQDPLGKQGRLAYRRGFTEVWTRDLQGGAIALAIINTAGPFPVLQSMVILISLLTLAIPLVGQRYGLALACAALLGLLLLVLLVKEGMHHQLLPLYLVWLATLLFSALVSRIPRRIARRAAAFGMALVFAAALVVWLVPEAGLPDHAAVSPGQQILRFFQSLAGFHLDLERLGLHGPQSARNLWTGETLTLTNGYPVHLRGHDVLLLRIEHPNAPSR